MPGFKEKLEHCKVLLVGAGGIGCEVLKNLTLTGFKQVDVIDLDTIDVSNLNRQFLFNKSNVGQSKSEVAVKIARQEYAPTHQGLSLNSIHKSITLPEFDVDFFRNYSLVINALDNRAARSHVNRMCLAADIPLLESGTTGYTGQLKMIKNSLTACYECGGIQKESTTYATCTIRNTPSLPIHCIVWAKHLFHQLFGESDPDNDVSPQFDNQVQQNGNSNTNHTAKADLSTRDWAELNDYDPKMLFQKLYNDDINYLLSMENLWKDRTKPIPLNLSDVSREKAESYKICDKNDLELNDQKLWSLKECVEVFRESVHNLHKRLKACGYQTWDKDDQVALNFVVAASNLRSKCFNIERKSPFDVKSMAGNIVPAISSTNSIIGGLLVLQAVRLLKIMPIGEDYRKLDDEERNKLLSGAGRMVFLNYTSFTRQDYIASFDCLPPEPSCISCSRDKVPEIEIRLSMQNTTLADLVDKVVIGTFHFVCPDISLDDDSGIIIYSKDEDEEQDPSKHKKLVELAHVKAPKTRLMISDLLQDKQIVMILVDVKIDEEKHKSFFYAHVNGHPV